ncbi:hypothetical protein HJC23_002647 [Cyclotella cryptica]|uniref:Protein kinase domain-containing protein n=1 Tax=Cyclotella cryptica TaxID=29204 RepID=A0ABD3PLJ1_9STRA|eukprot:CCRYP_013539-RB/>CCRYP_013539-RB protein AED:0.09 eAED:0.09 QI:163/1/1/1/0.75/0.6/5/225/536
MILSTIINSSILFLVSHSILADAFVSLLHPSPSRSKAVLHSAFTSLTVPSHNRRKVSSSLDVKLLEPIGNGTFGGVFWAKDVVSGRLLVAKSARAATDDQRAQQNAKSYLEIESYINSKLCPPSTNHAAVQSYQQHVAPYLGEITINRTMHLIWEASGEYTLEDYIEMEDGWVQLSKDLGLYLEQGTDETKGRDDSDEIARQMLHQRLAREVLRQLLEGLAYCHSLGVIHRDVKPANILVDPETKTLRLIDFGSACDMSSWTARAGYQGQNKGPRSILYCAPEEFVDEEHPYAFDIYCAAITWLRTILAEDGPDNKNDTRQKPLLGLGDEEHLFQWRLAVRDFGHNLVAWEEYAVLHNTLPYGWDSLFGSSMEGIQALRLLSNMMSYSPAQRMSASEALMGPYLNSGCNAAAPPELPPAMPWSIMSHVQRWKNERKVHSLQDEECRLEDLFTEVIAVELEWPLWLVLQERKESGGVMVAGDEYEAGIMKKQLHEGDILLAIGSIDVERASLEHVNELLEQWPRDHPVPLLFVRGYD